MHTIEKTIEVDAPLTAVYNQWTQFEEFPKFMDGVREVVQLDEKTLHWKAEIAGQEREWDAEILEQVPDKRIAWRSTSGAKNAGAVRFDRLPDGSTRVTLSLSYDPHGFEKLGDVLGFVTLRVQGDLKRFKKFIEKRGVETGAWRGEIHAGEIQHH